MSNSTDTSAAAQLSITAGQLEAARRKIAELEGIIEEYEEALLYDDDADSGFIGYPTDFGSY